MDARVSARRMSGGDTGGLLGLSDGGIAAKHGPVDDFQILVGPSTENEFNTARLRLIPVACWRVEDIRFDFDSSFILPGVKDEMRFLAKLIANHTQEATPGRPGQQPPISLFGHADPVGNDAVNKPLSGRRAATIYGMLTRRDEIWEDSYSNTQIFTGSAAGDNWGTRSIQIMLNHLAGPVDVDGEMEPQTQDAVRGFQSRNGLAVDGVPGRATRKKLFLAYMDALCVDGNGKPFQVDKEEGFLARHGDAGGKGDYQGCSAFNPALIFSSKRNAGFEQDQDKTARNAANAPNRRVMALLFRPGSRIDPAKWPCPRAKEGVSGCVKRLFSDGENRRGIRLPDKDRKFKDTQDTFACRFYQRLVTNSPCERDIELVPLRIRLIDPYHNPVKQANYALEVGDLRYEDATDDEGSLTHLIPALATSGTLKIAAWTVALDILTLGGAHEFRGARLRFENLGLAAVDENSVRSTGGAAEESGVDELLRRAILRFQRMVDLPTDGTLNEKTVAELRKVYGS